MLGAEVNQQSTHLHARIGNIVQRLRKLDGRLSDVTRSICGSAPENEGGGPKQIEETVHDKLNDVDGVIYSLEQEMVRLENSVGSRQQLQGAKAVASNY